jgi:hypothetical protein
MEKWFIDGRKTKPYFGENSALAKTGFVLAEDTDNEEIAYEPTIMILPKNAECKPGGIVQFSVSPGGSIGKITWSVSGAKNKAQTRISAMGSMKVGGTQASGSELVITASFTNNGEDVSISTICKII